MSKEYERILGFDPDDLQPGDVLLKSFYGSDPISHVIQLGQKLTHPMTGYARKVHAALYIGGGDVLESQGEGVVRNSLQANLRHGYEYTVYRYVSDSIDRDTVIQKVLEFANWQYEKTRPYSIFKAFSSLFSGKKTRTEESVSLLGDSTYFCSEFVAACYNQAGYTLDIRPLPIDLDPSSVSPQYMAAFFEKSPHWVKICELP